MERTASESARTGWGFPVLVFVWDPSAWNV